MANFGALTDHFSAITTGWTLKNSIAPTRPKSRADARDDKGDVCAATWFGATDIFEVTCDYELQSGTVDLNTLKLGEVEAGTAATSISVNPSNGGWPKLSITGLIGLETMVAPDGFLNTFTLPSITLAGAYLAQPMGFTYDAGSLTDCTFAFSADLQEATSGVGVPTAHGITGAIGTLTANWQRCPDETPAWTLTLSGLTSTQEPSDDGTQPDAAYHTNTSAAEIVIARDVDPA
jgi:hypothetical protein